MTSPNVSHAGGEAALGRLDGMKRILTDWKREAGELRDAIGDVLLRKWVDLLYPDTFGDYEPNLDVEAMLLRAEAEGLHDQIRFMTEQVKKQQGFSRLVGRLRLGSMGTELESLEKAALRRETILRILEERREPRF